MGKSRKGQPNREDEVYAKKKGKMKVSKVIYVDDREYLSGKGKGKVRYVYVSEDSETDSQELVVKKRSKHKVVRKRREATDSEGDDSSSYEVVKKRKKRPKKLEYASDQSNESEDSVVKEVVVTKRRKCAAETEDSANRRGAALVGKKKMVGVCKPQKNANVDGMFEELLPRKEVLIPNNSFGAVVSIVKDTTYYRSNIGGAMDKLSELVFKDEHLAAIKQTPFWYMFDAIYKKGTDKFQKMCHKYEADFRHIIETYDSDIGKFSIGGRMLSLTRTDVELIMGVSCGDVEIVLLDDGYTHPPWLIRCFKESIRNKSVKFVMYRNFIYRKIVELLVRKDKDSIEDVARLVNCFLIASIFTPLQSGAIRWQITCFMDDFPIFCSFNWSGYIVDVLKAQLKETTNMRSGGCTNILPGEDIKTNDFTLIVGANYRAKMATLLMDC